MTYIGYMEVRKLLGCSKKRAYEVILELREKSKWNETFECQSIRQIVIPKKIFLKFYPSCREEIKKLSA